jgi:tape measure domain-containing protein
MTTAAAAYLYINFAARIGKEIINVRGEFQQLGIAFETMLGSKERADKLMSEAVTFAAKTPFTLQDVATNIKQLMAMGVASESVMGTMKALGDVAAGVSVPISRIAVNYGQVMTLGTLQGRELRDFAMAGIPLIDELAKNLGKAKNEIQDMVTAGQIGAPDVTKAFQTMSAEGGKFFNLMEKQNASVTGQISNLTDRLQVAANEIGKSNEGLIYSGISGLSSIVANYKEIGETLIWLAGIYGGYKTAVMLISAVKAAEIAATTAKKAALAEQFAMEKASTAAEIAKAGKETAIASEMIRIESLKSASTAKTIAAKEAAALANEHLIASEKAYKATMMESSLASTYQQTQENQVKLKKELAEIEKSRIIASKANAKVSAAITSETILNANLEAAAIKKAKGEEILVTQAGILVKQEEALVTTVATGAEIRALQSKKALAAAQQLLNATMLNNPYVLGAVALGAIAYGTYKYITYQTELEKATSKMNVEIADEKGKILDLFTALKLTTEGTKEHEAAKKKLINTYGENISEQNKELISLGQVKNAYDEVTKAITDNIAARTRDELVGTIRTEYNTDSQKGKKNLINQFDGQAKSTVAFTINDLIDKFTIDKLSASDVEKQWKEFYQ